MTQDRLAPDITVLGVGNPIMADDALGLELLRRLCEARPDPRVEYVDGGTGGMELVPVVADSRRLLVLDAIAGPIPGTVVHLRAGDLPHLLSGRLSPHEVGLRDVFAAIRLLGRNPDEVEAIGIVPEIVEMRIGMSPRVEASLAEALAQAATVLDAWLTTPAIGAMR